ncbi:MraY family glycosyltransferase [Streptomyces sp. NBC_01433]|uniref:MraY family glycosyltransferase n=1 Tax=Streptomyces sp. NBC_01433 TaxID=2903864 RepID=UPI002B1CB957|nr:MraY family glycosyltransferase [Streptomyces sp. NBC_01433]
MGIITSGVVALFITVVLTAGIRRTTLRRRALDRPDGRKRHARPMSYLGGVATVLSVTGVGWAGSELGLAEPGAPVLPLLAVSGAVAAFGLVHDLKPLNAWLRLAAQVVAAAVFVSLAGLSPMVGVLAALWIVFLTNAFSTLDNSDGAMATVAVVTATGLLVCAALDGRSGVVLLLTVLVAALTGSLVHNWYPARIFPGECGSLFTGFVLAGSVVLLHAAAPPERAACVALPVLMVVAVADTALVLVSRRRAARPLLPDGGDHIAHRLRRIRFTAPGVAVVLGFGAVVGALTGTLVYAGLLHPLAGLVPSAGALLAVVALLRIPVYGGPPRRSARPAGRRRPAGKRTTGAVGAAVPAPASTSASSTAASSTAAASGPTVPPPPNGRPATELAADRR